jgi:hypothetical protein
MKRLLDAFLELPTWQGISLIVAFVAIQAGLCWWVSFWSYWRGRMEADAANLRFHAKQREREAIDV